MSMAVTREQEARELKLTAIKSILAKNPSLFGELRGQDVDGAGLIELFDQLEPDEQYKAYQQAGITLADMGYGIPSEATVAMFGPDGQMN